MYIQMLVVIGCIVGGLLGIALIAITAVLVADAAEWRRMREGKRNEAERALYEMYRRQEGR